MITIGLQRTQIFSRQQPTHRIGINRIGPLIRFGVVTNYCAKPDKLVVCTPHVKNRVFDCEEVPCRSIRWWSVSRLRPSMKRQLKLSVCFENSLMNAAKFRNEITALLARWKPEEVHHIQYGSFTLRQANRGDINLVRD